MRSFTGLGVIDADGTGLIEVEEDGGEAGVVMDGQRFVRTVMRSNDRNVGIFEDQLVVLRE